MFCGLRFKCCFLLDFVTFLMPSGFHLALFFRESLFRKLFHLSRMEPFRSHVLWFCVFFELCFWASFFVEFWGRFCMDVGFISSHVFCIFLDSSAPLVLVIFDNPSIRKRVSCKSKGIKFSTFSTCFVDFVSSSFFIGFCDLFEAIWSSIWHHFWEKNVPKIASKKGDPLFENGWLWRMHGAPRDAASYYSL